MQTGTLLPQSQQLLAVLFPGVELLLMGGSRDVQLLVPVLQLGHQQLQLPPLPLDGGASQVITRELYQSVQGDTKQC